MGTSCNDPQSIIPGKDRIQWLDALKGLAIVAVVFGHVLLGYVEKDSFPQLTDNLEKVRQWIYSWHIPLFFSLSGYSFSYSCFKAGVPQKAKIKRQILNIALIYLLFSIALFILKIIFSAFVNNRMNSKDLLYEIALPNTIMWYLWVLTVYYMVFPYIVRYGNRFTRCLPGILMLFSILGKTVSRMGGFRLSIRNLLWCCGFFYLGMLIENGKIKLVKSCYIVLSAVGIAAFAMGTLCFYDSYRALPLFCSILLETINGFAMIIFLIAFFSKWEGNGNHLLLCQVGRNSLVIYLLHTYFVTAMRVLLMKVEFHNAAFAIALTFLVPMSVTCGIAILSPNIWLTDILFKPVKYLETQKWTGGWTDGK